MKKISETNIRPLFKDDVTSPYFIKWLFNEDQFKNSDPKKYDCSEIIYNDKTNNYSYGYFSNGKLEGTIRITYTKGEDFYGLSFLYVNPERWNQGIGKKLIDFCLSKYGNNKLVLNVIETNKKAISIYENYGFKITRLIKDDIENYFVMERDKNKFTK